MKLQYIKPSCQFVEIALGSGILEGSIIVPGKDGEVIEDPDDVMSKSYQGGANSLLWEEN